MTEILQLLRCPNCGLPLHRREKTLACENGHSFDLAKSGYVNLLPPGKGKNARTGDDKGMIDARVNFLKRGFYNRISDAAAEAAADFAPMVNGMLSFCDM